MGLLESFICFYPFTGSQSVHSAALPEDAPYLLLEDLHYNHTHSDTHSLTQSNTHSVKHTLAEPQSPAETRVQTSSATDTETHSDPQLEMLTVTDTHSVTHPETGTHSDTPAAVLVQLQQVPAVQAANTERYEATAVEHIQYLLEGNRHAIRCHSLHIYTKSISTAYYHPFIPCL